MAPGPIKSTFLWTPSGRRYVPEKAGPVRIDCRAQGDGFDPQDVVIVVSLEVSGLLVGRRAIERVAVIGPLATPIRAVVERPIAGSQRIRGRYQRRMAGLASSVAAHEA